MTNGMMIASIFAVSLGFSLLHAANEVTRGTMTVGDFLLVNAYIARLVLPLESLGYAVRDVAQSLAFLDSMLAMFRRKEEPARAASREASRAASSLFRT